MTRITVAMIERQLDYLNELTGHELTPYGPSIDGKINPNAGNYHLCGAYGGHQIQQMCNTGTGTRNVTDGYQPKRQVYELLCAFTAGVKCRR